MRKHPRIGVLELSRVLQVARGTVQARLDRLERSGVITGYGPEIDVAAAGYPVQAFVTLDIAQGALDEVAAELAGHACGAGGVRDDRLVRRDLPARRLVPRRAPADPARARPLAHVGRSTSVVVLSVVVPTRALPLLMSSPRDAPRRAPAYRNGPDA